MLTEDFEKVLKYAKYWLPISKLWHAFIQKWDSIQVKKDANSETLTIMIEQSQSLSNGWNSPYLPRIWFSTKINASYFSLNWQIFYISLDLSNDRICSWILSAAILNYYIISFVLIIIVQLVLSVRFLGRKCPSTIFAQAENIKSSSVSWLFPSYL